MVSTTTQCVDRQLWHQTWVDTTGTLLELELSAMQAEGQGEVVSSPRVITANQREALIEQHHRREVAVTTDRSQADAPVRVDAVDLQPASTT